MTDMNARPRKPTDEKANARIELRVTDEDKARWVKLAKLHGFKGLTEFVVSMVKRAEKNLPKNPK